MTRRRTYLLLASLIGLVVIGLASPRGSLPSRILLGEPSGPKKIPEASQNTLPSKTNRAPRDTRPTISRTNALPRNTIIDRIDIENSSLEESIARLNELIRTAGVDPHELNIQLHDPYGVLNTRKARELKLVNCSIASILAHIEDQTGLAHTVSPAVLKVSHSTTPPELAERKLDHMVIPVINFDEIT